MKRISWLLIIVFFLSVVMPGVNLLWELNVAADTLRAAKITAVQGDVKILRAGGEKHFPAFKSMGLTQGDTVITGKDGRVTLEIAADKELKIGENSRIMISELVQSDSTNADKTSLNLKAGQVYTNIKGKLSPDSKYEIRTPTAVMGVRGTQFFVTLTSGIQAKVVTLEGSVVVTVPQLVTLEDGTTVTQDVEIAVQPNQIFVQTGDITEPGRFDLETLTGDVALSLFVLETLQEISEEQPDLINPEILQNLEEMIEKAKEEQQEQQQQQEMLQQQLQPSIQFDTPSTTSGGTSGTTRGNAVGNDDDDDDDNNNNEDLPRIVITTQLNDIYLQPGGELPRIYHIETVPADDVELEVEVKDDSIAEASFDGNYLFVYGLEPGRTTVTITARREGYIPAVKSFKVTVSEAYEEGDWDKTIIAEYGEHTDIALDSKGMPHIIYEDGSVRYRHWNGSFWQEEEPQYYSEQGSLAFAEIDGEYYSFISYNYYGDFGYDIFNGNNWAHSSFGIDGVIVGASSIDTTLYYNDYYGEDMYGTGVSYYDEANGNLYFRFNKYPTGSYIGNWGEPILVDGGDSDAGKYSSLAFGEDGKAYIAYYDYSDEGETGSLKLAMIDGMPDPEFVDIIDVDEQVGYSEGQYVSLAVDNESSSIHLAYYDAVNKKLKYAMWLDGEWFIETVDDSDGDVGKYASLALDNEGNPHISYYAENDSGGALKYARLDPDHEGEWLIEIIDQGEEVGMYSSIAFDKKLSIPHFAYIACSDEDWAVKHATVQGVMNTIEPDVLSGMEQDFEDASFLIESFGNEVSYVQADIFNEEDYRRELIDLEEGEAYYLSEDDEGLIFTLTGDFLNSLGFIPGYEKPHRIWIHFDDSLPVLLTIDVEEDYGANMERSKPDLAYDSINNRYLMVYERCMIDSYPEIWGRFINAGGEQGPEFAISEEEYCSDPKVVYNPENYTFLVTWQNNNDYLIYARILDNEGEPYEDSENFAVWPETENGQNGPAVAVNTTNGDYLIAWHEQVGENYTECDIFGRLLDKDGNPVEPDGGRLDLVSMEEYQGEPVLAYSSAGDQYLLAFRNTSDFMNSDVMGLMFDSGGESVSETLLQIAVGDSDQYAPALAADDANGRFLVVWQECYGEEPYNGINNIYGCFIDIDGTMGEKFPVYESEEHQYAPIVAYNSKYNTYMVVWQDANDKLYARDVVSQGFGIGEPVEIEPDQGFGNAAIAYNPEEDNYLVVYEDFTSYPHRIKCQILYPQLP